ncbi:hypothetical protein BDQ17DRAFT_1253205 [Cyathus striatus]|nr:hypothetical protein BDQ17DRAFT_1253205 [Cyathus striatus]
MKTAIANWLNYTVTPIPNPLLDPSNRNNRGIQHDLVGYLLCPVELDWENLDVHAKIRTGQHPDCSISTSFFIRFLYPKSFEPDLEDLEAGFLTGGLLVKAFKHIFTSPNSANEISLEDDDGNSEDENSKPTKRCKTSGKRRRGRRTVAERLNMTTVTPRTIAYVCIHVHFAMSCAEEWSNESEGFSYPDFYYFIVDFFEDTTGPEARKRTKKLLAWWNKYVHSYREYS